MVCSVKCYYGTGLTPGNVLDNIGVLNSADVKFRTFPDVAIKQTRALTSLRIASDWAGVEDLDYCVINNDCYWVTNITMINDNVAELSLMYDAITSVGVYNISVISGWCTRRCVTDDTLFANNLSEPFTPQQEMRIDFGDRILPNDNKGVNNFVVLTCGLYDNTNADDTILGGTLYQPGANVLEHVGEFLGVVVPEVPELSVFTSFELGLGTATGIVNSSIDSPMTCVFNLDATKVQYTLSKLNALGLNNAIVYAYSIPDCYCSTADITYVDGGGEQISKMHGSAQTVSSSLDVKFGDYKNNKVYSGQFYTITVLSISSGDSNTFEVEEIADATNNKVFYQIAADLQYIGYPFLFPVNYRGVYNNNMLGSVNGSQWMQAPIKEVGQEGWYWSQANKNLNAFSAALSSVGHKQVSDNFSSPVSNMLDPSGPVQYVQGDESSYTIRPRGLINSASDAILHATGAGAIERSSQSVKFSQLYTMQNYFGNAFFDYRTRLSDEDMQRFDRFLTMFGYRVNEPLTSKCFSGRQYFNYVQADAVNIRTAGFPLYVRRMVTQMLEQGVRIWHVMPNESAFSNNPISEV